MKIIVLASALLALGAAAQAQSPSGEVRITTWGANGTERATPPNPSPAPALAYAIEPYEPNRSQRESGVWLKRVALEGYLVPVNHAALRLADSGATLRIAGAPVAGPGGEARFAEIVSIPIRHAVTGVLRQEVRSGGILVKTRAIPAGSRVYAIAGARLDGEQAQRIWCAPIAVQEKGREEWDVTCFPTDPDGGLRYVHLQFDGLLAGFMPLNDRPGATAVDVEEREVEPFSAMRLTYFFSGWKADAADIAVRAIWDNGSEPLGGFSIPRASDGSARLSALNGEFLLRPGATDPKAAVVEVVRAPSPTTAWPFEN